MGGNYTDMVGALQERWTGAGHCHRGAGADGVVTSLHRCLTKLFARVWTVGPFCKPVHPHLGLPCDPFITSASLIQPLVATPCYLHSNQGEFMAVGEGSLPGFGPSVARTHDMTPCSPIREHYSPTPSLFHLHSLTTYKHLTGQMSFLAGYNRVFCLAL